MTLTARIEDWFTAHEDGEFVYHERSMPFTVIGPSVGAHGWLYMTKPAIGVLAMGQSEVPFGLGLVGCYGLPNPDDAAWLSRLVDRGELLFLGDMDPPDLMVFAWLRERLPCSSVRYLGVSDRLLAALNLVLPPHFEIFCCESERESLPLLRQVFPDVDGLIGLNCARLLNEGRKLELEAIVSALGGAAPLLQAAGAL